MKVCELIQLAKEGKLHDQCDNLSERISKKLLIEHIDTIGDYINWKIIS